MELEELPQPDVEDTVPVDDLEVDGDNPNEQPDEMFGLLCERMRDNGWLGGPIITDTDGVIADGEHRWRAAQEIGLEEVPVRQFDIDDATRRLWRQELNKISGEHDPRRDALEYDHLLKEGRSDEVQDLVDATGEDLDELLERIRVSKAAPVGYEYDPDHEVYFEDCLEGMRTRLDDDSVDLVFTSPPYNVSLASGDDPKTEKYTAYQDEWSTAEYREFIGDVLDELARVVKPTGHVFFNIHINVTGGDVTTHEWICDRMPIPWKSYIVWNKENSSRSTIHLQEQGRFLQSWEPVYHFAEDPPALKGRRNFSVWDVSQSSYEPDHDTGVHPAPFPVELVKRAIEPCTEPGDVLLDPFMGSGTTAVAAIETDRAYVGFELDEEDAYQPIVERRISEAKRALEATVNSDSER